MTGLVEKAHQGGRRMGAYIAARDGVARALERGSLAHVRYERKALRDAYDRGYAEAVAEASQEVRNG